VQWKSLVAKTLYWIISIRWLPHSPKHSKSSSPKQGEITKELHGILSRKDEGYNKTLDVRPQYYCIFTQGSCSEVVQTMTYDVMWL
jgi:hypothetical protein